ncbi:hypothetical protein CC86DRAFT_409136 [Ophiobolus disseminans]|uniref:Uncharacterized protein n=1 Tax=Ophiobolus disseminans TaxID=1469910 RepID=A0A6A6ZQU9_9PLEO|nr:hypothetical protein CC86DRAFT_409136 [Ophiobolus disseminans]
MHNRVGEFVEKFSSAPRVEKALKIKVVQEKLGMAIGSAIGLVASGGLAFLPPKLDAQVNTFNLITNVYIDIAGIINAARKDNPEIVDNLAESIRASFNEMIHKSNTSIARDLFKLMEGYPNGRNQNIVDFMTGGEFLTADPDLCPKIEDHGYAPQGCEKDHRAHSNYRVCLPETPRRSYWLFSIDSGREKDSMTDDQAEVKGPTGWKAFYDKETSSYNITRENIVRLLLFVHGNRLEDAVANIDVERLGEVFANGADQKWGNVPGAFAVPVCRNSGGEAISSVWSEDARNYPCMCGEFLWDNDGAWSTKKDQTLKFLHLSTFMFSEDWEDCCSNHNDCKGVNGIDWRPTLEKWRKPGDPPIPKSLKHPFHKCEDANEHDTFGHPEKDDEENGKKDGKKNGEQSTHELGLVSLSFVPPGAQLLLHLLTRLSIIKTFLNFPIGLAISLVVLLNAAPTSDDDFQVAGYDPSKECHNYSTAQTWIGTKSSNVGTDTGPKLYDEAWTALDKQCPSNDGHVCKTNAISCFDTTIKDKYSGHPIANRTSFRYTRGEWTSETARKLIISAVASATAAMTNVTTGAPNLSNCFDLVGEKSCNVADTIRVNFPRVNEFNNYLHTNIMNLDHKYGSWDCCGNGHLQDVDKGTDVLGPQIANYLY